MNENIFNYCPALEEKILVEQKKEIKKFKITKIICALKKPKVFESIYSYMLKLNTLTHGYPSHMKCLCEMGFIRYSATVTRASLCSAA